MHKNLFYCFISLSFLFVFGTAIGCSPKVPLHGTVTFSDGTPVPQGTVNFLSETKLARGTINPDGTFVVGSTKLNDGLLPGTYKVYVTGVMEEMKGYRPPSPRPGTLAEDIVPSVPFQEVLEEQYTLPEKTPITCTVPAKGNNYNFTVEKRSK
ncbi:MAG: carboxypeptidase-like regulatory domain-containing protein [Thermoguttaceae bacterium]